MKSDIGMMSMDISTKGTRCKYCKRDGEYSCVDCKKGRRDAFIVDKDKLFVDFVSRKTRTGKMIALMFKWNFFLLAFVALADMAAILFFDGFIVSILHIAFVASIFISIVVDSTYFIYGIVRAAKLEMRLQDMASRLIFL